MFQFFKILHGLLAVFWRLMHLILIFVIWLLYVILNYVIILISLNNFQLINENTAKMRYSIFHCRIAQDLNIGNYCRYYGQLTIITKASDHFN